VKHGGAWGRMCRYLLIVSSHSIGFCSIARAPRASLGLRLLFRFGCAVNAFRELSVALSCLCLMIHGWSRSFLAPTPLRVGRPRLATGFGLSDPPTRGGVGMAHQANGSCTTTMSHAW
jgi:hypothetical protein